MKKLFNFFEELEGEKGPISYKGKFLPFDSINILLQTRRTFQGIEELALDIAKKGLLHPITVACFSKETCKLFLDFVNKLWGTSYDIKTLITFREKKREAYFVLLAGERRFRAMKHIWEKGCADCQEKYGREPEGTCYKRHFRSNLVEVRQCSLASPLTAIYIQLSENTHMRVPPTEEAHAYKQLFTIIKEVNPSYPLSRFAKNVGRSPSFIKSVLRFCELPVWTQKIIENNPKLWGKGLVLAVLYEKVKNEDELRYWTMIAIVGRHNSIDFRSAVGKYLSEVENGQQTLLEIFGEEANREAQKRHIRLTVEQGTVQVLWSGIAYLRRVIDLFNREMLGQEYSPFSAKSPLKVFRALILTSEETLQHIEKLLPKKYLPCAKEIIAEAKKTTEDL